MSDISKTHAFELNGKQIPALSLPRVSVVVTCFNYGRFVVDALNSVALQTYPEFNCVVVDDASTDDSAETVKRWISGRGDARFTIIQNETNLGQMGSIKAGLSVLEGDFVAFLDADDTWFPSFLARHIEVHLNRVQAAGASCSDLVQIDAVGRVLAGSVMVPTSASKSRTKKIVLSDPGIPALGAELNQTNGAEKNKVTYVEPDLGRWHWSLTSGMVFRRPLVDLFVPANTERLRLGADIYMIFLCHCFTGSFLILDVLGAYRRHGQNNFSSLPILGQSGSAPVAAAVANLRNSNLAILEHMLEASDRISAIFSPALYRKRLRLLFRLFLIRGEVPQDPKIASIVGNRRLFTDRLLAKVGFLRRKMT
jgi:glycosyltransferase involved in cell wall biosynthesis